jgi:hypothetical protein
MSEPNSVPNTDPTQPAQNPPAAQPDLATEPGQEPAAPATFEDWAKDQPKEILGLVENHTANLKSALASERTERKKLADQLKEISGQLEEGSEAKKQLEAIGGQMDTANTRADFYEQAAIAGISGNSIKLAWAAAGADGLIEEFVNGRTRKVEWVGLFERMKTDYPNLFSTPVPARAPVGNAGNGAGQPVPTSANMNQIIRRGAGRGQ